MSFAYFTLIKNKQNQVVREQVSPRRAQVLISPGLLVTVSLSRRRPLPLPGRGLAESLPLLGVVIKAHRGSVNVPLALQCLTPSSLSLHGEGQGPGLLVQGLLRVGH